MKVNKTRDYYTVGMVARMFGVSGRTISNLFDKGQFEGHRLPFGRQERRITHASLHKYLDAHPDFKAVLIAKGHLVVPATEAAVT